MAQQLSTSHSVDHDYGVDDEEIGVDRNLYEKKVLAVIRDTRDT